MNPRVFDKLRRIIYDQSGIRLQDGKMSLVASRIGRRLRDLSLESELEYIKHLEKAMDTEVVHLLDAISTNVTSFFRESHHFDMIRDAFKGWLEAGQTRFRFWSAASSTGEEPYSLAMTLDDVATRMSRQPDVKILATDISTRVLQEAKAGLYDEARIAGIPGSMRKRYLRKESDAGVTRYRMNPKLQSMILFKRMNLSQPPFPMKGPLDVILCRNVMIYFDQPVRDRLIAEFHRLLRSDGYLMVGHAESLTRATQMFDRGGNSVYRPLQAGG